MHINRYNTPILITENISHINITICLQCQQIILIDVRSYKHNMIYVRNERVKVMNFYFTVEIRQSLTTSMFKLVSHCCY